jgi:transposase
MRKAYTKEFKQQAVELAVSLGSIAGAARQLGVSDVNIHSWKKAFGKLQGVQNKINSEQSEELRQLRRENAELKKVNHILKSAAAFFSQDHLK